MKEGRSVKLARIGQGRSGAMRHREALYRFQADVKQGFDTPLCPKQQGNTCKPHKEHPWQAEAAALAAMQVNLFAALQNQQLLTLMLLRHGSTAEIGRAHV